MKIKYNVNWYPNKYPEKNDIVVIKFDHLEDIGIFVKLLEYKKAGAYLVSRFKRPMTLKKTNYLKYARISELKFDQNESIDLIFVKYFRITPEDKKRAKTQFYNYQKIMKLLLSLSEDNDEQFRELVEKIVYPLHEEHGNAYLALKMSLKQPEILSELDITNDIKMNLFEQLQEMFAQPVFRIKALFQAEIFTSGGVDLLRNALVEGYEALNEPCFKNSNEELNLSIKIIAPPNFSVSIDVLDTKQGLNLVGCALKKIENKMVEYKGRFSIIKSPNFTQIKFDNK